MITRFFEFLLTHLEEFRYDSTMEEIIIQFHQIDDQIEFPHIWEQIVIQFPHLGEQRFNQLDGRISESVEKFKNLLGSFLFILTVKDFHGSKPWIRAINLQGLVILKYVNLSSKML